jgi:hypothetical protein
MATVLQKALSFGGTFRAGPEGIVDLDRLRGIEVIDRLDPATGKVGLGCVRIDTSDPQLAELLPVDLVGDLNIWWDAADHRRHETFGPLRVAFHAIALEFREVIRYRIVLEPTDQRTPAGTPPASAVGGMRPNSH